MSSTTPSILEKIYAQRKKDVENAKSTPGTTPKDLGKLLDMRLAPSLIPFIPRLKQNPSSNTSPSLMAEIKRASPSKGDIALDANAAQQAQIYALAGASVISVLTEPTWFKGSLLDLRLARDAIATLPNRPALLRKDFILDEYQIDEARLYGADTILLIVAMLSPEQLESLYKYSISRGMEPLVEVNNAEEMEHALKLGAKAIGVNNRNLHDFQVDMGTTSRLADMLKGRDDTVLCALSGISTNADVQTYAQQGVGAVLVGESLMRAKDTEIFIRTLLGWSRPPPLPLQHATSKMPWIKATGISSSADAKIIIAAGADMLGFVFDATEPHCVTTIQAQDICSKLRAARKLVPAPPFAKAQSQSEPFSVPGVGRNIPWFTTHMVNLLTTARRPILVGIFKNQPLTFIIHTTLSAQFDLVQLDGDEPASWINYIPVPVIRRFVVHCGTKRPGQNAIPHWDAEDLSRPGLHAFTLLGDINSAYSTGDDGGSSGHFWDKVKKAIKGGEAPGFPMPIIMDMELPLENLGNEIKNTVPWALDIKRPEGMDSKEFAELVKGMKSGG